MNGEAHQIGDFLDPGRDSVASGGPLDGLNVLGKLSGLLLLIEISSKKITTPTR